MAFAGVCVELHGCGKNCSARRKARPPRRGCPASLKNVAIHLAALASSCLEGKIDGYFADLRNAVRAEKAKKHPGENEKFWILVEEYIDRFKPQ
jgi:hypothetical protein